MGGTGDCWVCQKPNAEYFCDEWDTFLHRLCIPKFLVSAEGQTVMNHGHAIYVEEVKE